MEPDQQVVVEEATCRQCGFRRHRPALPKMASLGLGVWSFHSRPRGHAGFACDNTTGFAQDMDNPPFDVLKDPCGAMSRSLEIPVLISVSGTGFV
jgi:hypothetical protein